jgi:phosphoglycerate dehydrogenase-like enzyme
VLKALGPHGVLINVARGSVVDEEALMTALCATGTIMSAGLDVFAREPHVPQALDRSWSMSRCCRMSARPRSTRATRWANCKSIISFPSPPAKGR